MSMIYPDDRRVPKTSSTGIKTWSSVKPVVSTIYDQGYTPTPGKGAGGSASYWERINQGLIDRAVPGDEGDPLNIDTPDLGYGGITASDLAAILAATGSGSGGSTAASQLARDEFNYKKQQDAMTKAKSDAALKAMQDRYSSGGYRENADALLKILSGQETTGKKQIGTAYDDAIANIGDVYDAAQLSTNAGYDVLDEYLAKNQSNPYAGYQSKVGTLTNPMEDLLAAYGVGAEPVRAQVAAEQLASQQGGNAFQDLMNILAATTSRGNESRLAESKMARQMAGTNLGATSSAYQSQAANQQQKSLSDLLNQLTQSRFGIEQGAGQNADALANAILSAGGTVNAGSGTAQTNPQTLQDLLSQLGNAPSFASPNWLG